MNKKRVIEIVLELVAATAFVAGVVAWAIYVPPSRDFEAKWVFLGLNTAVLFSFPVVWFKKQRKSVAFWIRLIGLLLVHTIVYVGVLSRVRAWPLMFYALAAMPELWIIGAFLEATPEPIKEN